MWNSLYFVKQFLAWFVTGKRGSKGAVLCETRGICHRKKALRRLLVTKHVNRHGGARA